MNDMEKEFIKELEQTRKERDQMKEDAENCRKTLADFKKRMQNQLSNELDYSGACSENIMDPCRESEVVRMYDNMKTQSWGETKEKLWKSYSLQSTDLREHAAMLIKMVFDLAVQNVKRIRYFIDNTCRVQPATSQKTVCLNKITHDFQLFFYYCDLDYFKSVVKEYVCTGHGGVCIDLAAECYKVATLMALHEPQLTPVWEVGSWPFGYASQKVFPVIYKNNVVICKSE
ncbi:uncharacterized protein si:dkey-61p9.7 [Brienomyrus brachyistius]|uniref:uncharacterized protein si:dkey-61p9.7 n=1 Tax=Brienomyrus brachyistius TaxID=42636 RepID=UPI0020B20F05|nr:uncharacterized protein si:dkey-61p9.7 [Brienomyrus brachyistius]